MSTRIVPKEPGGEGYRGTVRLERAGREVNNQSFGVAQPALFQLLGDLFDVPVGKKLGFRIDFIKAAFNKSS